MNWQKSLDALSLLKHPKSMGMDRHDELHRQTAMTSFLPWDGIVAVMQLPPIRLMDQFPASLGGSAVVTHQILASLASLKEGSILSPSTSTYIVLLLSL